MRSANKYVSFQNVFRLIFVIFSLYLLQDVFFRWDGVAYYSTLSAFLPGVALVSILWTITAFLTSIFIWMPLSASKWICQRLAWRFNADALLLFISCIISLGIIIWLSQRALLDNESPFIAKLLGKLWFSKQAVFSIKSLFFTKLAVICTAIIFSIVISWKLRGKSQIIQEHITPLVWIFGIMVIISLPLVIYTVWNTGESKLISQDSTRPSAFHQNSPNIVLITFDALSARDMSVYGYHRPTTPFIGEWSKNATVFTKTVSQSNYTHPTTLSLMTGQRPWTHRQYNPNGYNSLTRNNLAGVLKNNGYYNMAFTQNPLASVTRLGIKEDFDINFSHGKNKSGSILGWLDDLLYKYLGDHVLLCDWIMKPDFLFGMILTKITDNYVTEYSLRKIFDNIVSKLADNPPSPYFIWTHLNPPHDPYLPPEPYIGLFDASSRLRTQKSQYKFTRPDENDEMVNADQETIYILRARYNEFIRYCDQEFNYLIDQLEKKDILKDTVIILSTDHGESFEHGILAHGTGLYEEMTHIPLIIKEPGQTQGRLVNTRVEQVDITATILDLSSIPVPVWMEGRSLKPFLHGERLSPRPVYSMSLFKNRQFEEISQGLIAVWDGDYKLIYDFSSREALLFDLAQDPSELNNLYDKKPETSERLLSLIKENLIKANNRISEDKRHP